MSNSSLNVLRQPLKLFSTHPPTGFHRDGYCRTSPLDHGQHAVAGILTNEFLDFTAAQGNDLRGGAGLTAGCKWCLCTARWREAYRAFEAGRVPRAAVPRVDLAATEESALRSVDLAALRAFAVEDAAAASAAAAGAAPQPQQVNGNGHVNGNGNGVNGVNGVNGTGDQ